MVGELDHLVALVVMAENHESIAEGGASGGNASIHHGVGQAEILLGQGLALGDVLLFELSHQRNHRRHRHR